MAKSVALEVEGSLFDPDHEGRILSNETLTTDTLNHFIISRKRRWCPSLGGLIPSVYPPANGEGKLSYFEGR
ncbi:hypothetical protein EVAR_87461_1 [Eumeta japonica]|uniref:Uncharacterized protein n=1 Tax=Eumeta variegata TaxID=151549 RepID=A0A4C1W055_EUMVA|nr:hypothetical protein EVAR_87461_1 [Eumeta japonica]